MSLNGSFARHLRMRRLYRYRDDRLLIVPLDHSVSEGPITGGRRLNGLVGQLTQVGVDAVVLHKGSLRHVDHDWFTEIGLIVHLSASTAHAPDPDAKYLVAGVEEALRLGADAVSVHVNLGSAQEARQVADLASVADACDRWNVPLIAMMYPRGPKVTDPREPALVAHAASLAADLGADAVKTVYTGDVTTMADIVDTCPLPIVVAGGSVRGGGELAAYAADVLKTGVAGLAVGRSVFQSPNPTAAAELLVNAVHPHRNPTVDATVQPHRPQAEVSWRGASA